MKWVQQAGAGCVHMEAPPGPVGKRVKTSYCFSEQPDGDAPHLLANHCWLCNSAVSPHEQPAMCRWATPD